MERTWEEKNIKIDCMYEKKTKTKPEKKSIRPTACGSAHTVLEQADRMQTGFPG